MKSANIFKTLSILLIIVGCSTAYVFAEDLDSTNYKIVGAKTATGGGLGDSTNYSVISSLGKVSADPRVYSTNYRLYQDPSAAFLAAQPTVQCFETTTDGSTACTSGPQELLDGGMVAICGTGGCYNKARFEISSNPYKYNTSASGLVSYWPMDESADNLCTDGDDACDRKYINNGVSTGSTIVDGIYGNARRFDGTDDYVDFGNDTSLDLTTQGTIAVWVKTDRSYPSDTVDVDYRGIVNKAYSASTPQISYFIDWYGNNSSVRTLRAAISNGTTLLSTTIANFNFGAEWNLIVFTFDGSYLNLYVNGELARTPVAQTVNAQATTYPLRIGRVFYGSVYTWEGDLDEVSIFNRALSASEISDMWQGDTDNNINPPDTLYSVQISTDNFVSDIQYIDGSTFRPESYANHNINDYRTEAVWEAETFNIQGLDSNKQYYIRITALHGDFTQSDYSSIATATTAAGSISFDIDIAISSGIDTESAPPYSVSFSSGTALIAGAAATTATSLAWLDIDSSSVGGVSVILFSKYGGLYSATTTQTITSSTEDLDVTGAEGFGLQSYYIDYDDSSPFYGDLTATTDYSGSINSVGGASTTANKIYSGDGPIVAGRTGAYLKARAGTGITPASDYSEEIYFVLVPLY